MFVIFSAVLLILLSLVLFWASFKLSKNKITFEWLQNSVFCLSLTFFFERIPSLETSFGPIRLSHILITFCIYLLICLILKKDPKLLQTKLPKELIFLVLFLVFSTASFLNVVNTARFLSAFVATILCFLSTFFIATFLPSVPKLVKYFSWLFILLIIFSFYQFFGDLLGLPSSLSGVKDLFQSNVFGFPRIHATYNEPAYFANSLFLGIFWFLFLSLTEVNIFTGQKVPLSRGCHEVAGVNSTQYKKGWLSEAKTGVFSTQRSLTFLTKNFQLIYLLISLILFGIFILTLAKSAWVILPVVLAVALYPLSKFDFFGRFKKLFVPIFAVVSILGAAVFVNNQGIVNNIFSHLIETFEGESATASERKAYYNSAVELIEKYPIVGIGPGQFGTLAHQNIINNLWPNDRLPNYINPLKKSEELPFDYDTQKTITFNVYVEIWLEHGLLPLLLFCAMFLTVLARSFGLIFKAKNQLKIEIFLIIVCSLYLIASLLQWFYISPIYLNPIFVILGILIGLNKQLKDENNAS